MVLPLSNYLEDRLTGKDLLIFDFDGTVASTTPLHNQAFIDTLSPFNMPVDYSSLAGLSTRDAITLSFNLAGRQPPNPHLLSTLIRKKQTRVRELISSYLLPTYHMHEFLQWAKSRFALALVTSGSRETVSLALSKLSYDTLFSTQIFAEDVETCKPDPEGFLLALKAHSCQPHRALVFEDSEAGLLAARNASLDVVDVTQLPESYQLK